MASGPPISLAYADGLAAVAWSAGGPVGVDVERVGPPVDLGHERVDRAAWTEHEARFKAGGADPGGLPSSEMTGLPGGWVGTVVGEAVSWRVVRV